MSGVRAIEGVVRDVELEWFALRCQGVMFTRRGTAFQDFFADLMEAAHPGDFERVRPYGNKGDLKCDGLLRSRGHVFQVYAPRETKEQAMLAKIREDFAGAKKHWKTQMCGWTFVHNDMDGLPPGVVQEIDGLQKKNKTISIETWAHERLQTIALGLPRAKIVAMFGRPPNRQDFDRLTFEPLARVLAAVRGQDPVTLEDIAPVSPKKLEANALGSAAADYLRLGRQREHLVQQYFEKHPNPTLGEEVAAAFRDEYSKHRKDGLDANTIFAALQEFAGGSTRGDAEHEAAVLAVMSYLFERCDIFEAPQVPS
ncbi:MAG: hypothetical protein H0U13_15265 [Gemmatimonadaceae bacterium]|nr:hypothetical protein [Gemmatimonadaceae bacterium]